MKKVYIVKSNNNIEGVYATREGAEKAKERATWEAGMAGRYDVYVVKEHEVKE